jgi:hypothetical protein
VSQLASREELRALIAARRQALGAPAQTPMQGVDPDRMALREKIAERRRALTMQAGGVVAASATGENQAGALESLGLGNIRGTADVVASGGASLKTAANVAANPGRAALSGAGALSRFIPGFGLGGMSGVGESLEDAAAAIPMAKPRGAGVVLDAAGQAVMNVGTGAGAAIDQTARAAGAEGFIYDFGRSMPQTGTSMLAAAVGGLAGGPAGAILSSMAVNVPLEFGALVREAAPKLMQKNPGMTFEEAAVQAAVPLAGASLASAGLESAFGAEGVAGKAFADASARVARGWLQKTMRGARTVAKSGAEEAATEPSQGTIGQIGQSMAGGGSVITPEEFASHRGQEALMGGASGVIFGGGAAAVGGARSAGARADRLRMLQAERARRPVAGGGDKTPANTGNVGGSVATGDTNTEQVQGGESEFERELASALQQQGNGESADPAPAQERSNDPRDQDFASPDPRAAETADAMMEFYDVPRTRADDPFEQEPALQNQGENYNEGAGRDNRGAETITEGTSAPAAKQPWEMTREEYTDKNSLLPAVRDPETGQFWIGKRSDIHATIEAPGYKGTGGLESGWATDAGEYIKYGDAAKLQPSSDSRTTWKRLRDNHSAAVTIAFAEGKSVPASVLADYPELAKLAAEKASRAPADESANAGFTPGVKSDIAIADPLLKGRRRISVMWDDGQKGFLAVDQDTFEVVEEGDDATELGTRMQEEGAVVTFVDDLDRVAATNGRREAARTADDTNQRTTFGTSQSSQALPARQTRAAQDEVQTRETAQSSAISPASSPATPSVKNQGQSNQGVGPSPQSSDLPDVTTALKPALLREVKEKGYAIENPAKMRLAELRDAVSRARGGQPSDNIEQLKTPAKPRSSKGVIKKLRNELGDGFNALLVQEGWEITESGRVYSDETRGSGGKIYITDDDFANWLADPKKGPISYGQDDPEFAAVVAKARKIAGVEPFGKTGELGRGQPVSNPDELKATGSKEPWEMTRAEFRAETKKDVDFPLESIAQSVEMLAMLKLQQHPVIKLRNKKQKVSTLQDAQEVLRYSLGDWADAIHEAHVEMQIRGGKTVPPGVLADYPKLAKSTAEKQGTPVPAPATPSKPKSNKEEQGKPAPAGDKAESEKKLRERKPIGVNTDGKKLYEDGRGVRSVETDSPGIIYTEPVRLNGYGQFNGVNRSDEFRTAEELEAEKVDEPPPSPPVAQSSRSAPDTTGAQQTERESRGAAEASKPKVTNENQPNTEEPTEQEQDAEPAAAGDTDSGSEADGTATDDTPPKPADYAKDKYGRANYTLENEHIAGHYKKGNTNEWVPGSTKSVWKPRKFDTLTIDSGTAAQLDPTDPEVAAAIVKEYTETLAMRRSAPVYDAESIDAIEAAYRTVLKPVTLPADVQEDLSGVTLTALPGKEKAMIEHARDMARIRTRAVKPDRKKTPEAKIKTYPPYKDDAAKLAGIGKARARASSRYAIEGVLITPDGKSAVVTDGRRLWLHTKAEDAWDVQPGLRSMGTNGKIGGIIPDREFPPWAEVVPRFGRVIGVFKPLDVLKNAKRAAVFATENVRGVVMVVNPKTDYSPESLGFSGVTEAGQSFVNIQRDCSLLAGVNPDFMSEAAEWMHRNGVQEFTLFSEKASPKMPIVMQGKNSDGDTLTAVTMPVSLEGNASDIATGPSLADTKPDSYINVAGRDGTPVIPKQEKKATKATKAKDWADKTQADASEKLTKIAKRRGGKLNMGIDPIESAELIWQYSRWAAASLVKSGVRTAEAITSAVSKIMSEYGPVFPAQREQGEKATKAILDRIPENAGASETIIDDAVTIARAEHYERAAARKDRAAKDAEEQIALGNNPTGNEKAAARYRDEAAALRAKRDELVEVERVGRQVRASKDTQENRPASKKAGKRRELLRIAYAVARTIEKVSQGKKKAKRTVIEPVITAQVAKAAPWLKGQEGEVRRVVRALRRDAKAGGKTLEQAYNDAVGELAATGAAMREQSRARRDAARAISQLPPEQRVSAKAALKARLKAEGRAALKARSEGARITAKITTQNRRATRREVVTKLTILHKRMKDAQRRKIEMMKFERQGAVDAVKDAAKDREKIQDGLRDEAINLIETYVPASLRGKYLRSVRDAKTMLHLARITERVRHDMVKALARDELKMTEQVSKRANVKKMLEEYREIVLEARKELEQIREEIRNATSDLEIINLAAQLAGVRSRFSEALHRQKADEMVRVGDKVKKREDVIESTLEALRKRPDIPREKGLSETARESFAGKVNRFHLTPDTIGAMMGDPDAHKLLALDFFEGEDLVHADRKSAEDAMKTIVEAAGYKWGSDELMSLSRSSSGRASEVMTMKLPDAGSIDATPAEWMGLYATATDAGANANILDGTGITWNRDKYMDEFKLSAADLEALEAQLPKPLKQIVVETKRYIESNVREGVFAAYREQTGFDLIKVQNYWPTKRNRNQPPAERLINAKPTTVRRALENLGFLQEREPATNTPYLVGDFFKVFHDHTYEAAAMTHMTRRVRSTENVFKDKRVRREIAKKFGDEMNTEIDKIIEAGKLIDPQDLKPLQRTVNMMSRAFSKAKLTLNPVTWMKQIGGVFNLLAYVSPPRLVRAIGKMWSAEVNEIMSEGAYYHNRYNDAVWRRVTPALGERGPLLGQPDMLAIGKRLALGDKVAGGIFRKIWAGQVKGRAGAIGDAIDRIAILNWFDSLCARVAIAAKLDEHKGLGKNERIERATRESALLMRRTQNGHSVLEQSSFARDSRGTLASAMLLFTSEPIKRYNMITRGYAEDGLRGAARGGLAGALNTAWASMVVYLFGGLLGDDDEKRAADAKSEFVRGVTGISYAAAPLNDMIDAVVRATAVQPQKRNADYTQVPALRPVEDLVRGIGDIAASLGPAGEGRFKSGENRGESKAGVMLWDGVERVGLSVSDMLGLPISPGYRYIRRYTANLEER